MVKSAPVINGYTYYEYDVAQGAASVTVSGTATIDELRLYPKSSRMRTITYDPLIGKTSECDENNRITYYEYEELGRLRFVKDENKNIVKMYEYNYTKQKGCPATYANHSIAEIFTKNDCGAGYVGSAVPYPIIPAGRYTSTISQADADKGAQNELNTRGQAYANTNGSCIKLYYNTLQYQDFTKQSCAVGYKGSTIRYSVPANKYTSTVNQATADTFALREIKANGQAFANNDASVGCAVNTDAVWEANDPASIRC